MSDRRLPMKRVDDNDIDGALADAIGRATPESLKALREVLRRRKARRDAENGAEVEKDTENG